MPKIKCEGEDFGFLVLMMIRELWKRLRPDERQLFRETIFSEPKKTRRSHA